MFGYDLISVLVVLIAVVVLLKPAVRVLVYALGVVIGVIGGLSMFVYYVIAEAKLKRKKAKVVQKVKLCSEADIEFKTFLRAVARECSYRGVQFTSVQFAKCRYAEGFSAKQVADEWIQYVQAK